MSESSASSFNSAAGLLSRGSQDLGDSSADPEPSSPPRRSALKPVRAPRTGLGFQAAARAAAHAGAVGPDGGGMESEPGSPAIRAFSGDSNASGSPLLRPTDGDRSKLGHEAPPAKIPLGPGVDGRKGSYIGARRRQRGLPPTDPTTGKAPPTNEEIAQAVQEKVAAAVETQRKYKHVLWYSLFVAAYLIVLYLQASAYNSGEVVSTLRNQLMPDGGMTATFSSGDEVLAYIGEKILTPTWVDPVCGDGNCEYPWEFPAYGPFGCQADCGKETQITPILVQVQSNFVGHPTISPSVLMASATWNLCLDDPTRRSRGEQDLCWFSSDQTFTEIEATRLETMSVIDGTWYIYLKGDYAGRVSGNVYDIRNQTNPILLVTDPAWDKCALPTSTSASATVSTQVRRLLSEWSEGNRQQRMLLSQEADGDGNALPRPMDEEDIHEAITDLTKRLKKLVKEMTAPKFDDGIARRPEIDDDDFIPEYVH